MQQLRELVEITQNETSLRPLADPDGQTMMGKLYRAILSGSDVDEAQVVEQVYGKGSSSSLPAYQKLKSRLRNVLLDALLDVSMRDKPDYSSYRDAYRTLQRQYASAQVLLSMRAYHNCVHVLERVYRMASKYGIVELQYQSSQRLMGLYLGAVHNPKKFVFYRDVCSKHRMEFIDDGTVYEALYTFKNSLYHRLGGVEEVARVAYEQERVVKAISIKQPHAYRIKSMYLELASWARYLDGNLKEAIRIANESENYLMEVKLGGGAAIYNSRVMQFNACGLLHDLEAAEEVACRINEHLVPNTINWFDFQEKRFFFYVRLEMYEEACCVANEIDRKRLHKKLDENYRQLWEMIFALVHFFQVSGLVAASETPKKFRVKRFLNSIPTYSKEKRGMNVQALIIHTMLLLVLQRFDEVIDRVESLEKYCSRHLRGGDQLRSNCFIKMLTSVVRGNFHVVATERYAKPYVKRLNGTEQNVLDVVYNTELIAYEILWGIVLDNLGTKVYRRGFRQVG